MHTLPALLACIAVLIEAYDFPAWRVGYVHIPKTGGTSVGYSLASQRVPACKEITGHGMPLCYCTPKNPSDVGGKYFKRGRDGMEGDCAASADLGSSSESATTRFRLTNATVAISESHYDVIVDDWKIQAPHLFVGPDASRWLWVSVVRRPRDWFYSYVGTFCGSSQHRDNVGCAANATPAELRVGDGRWFDAIVGRSRHLSLANPQSAFLGSIFLEEHWLICSVERLSTVYSTIVNVERVLNRRKTGSDQDHRRQPPALHTTHTGVWPLAEIFRQHTPWSAVSRYYEQDELLYKSLQSTGGDGCKAHTENRELRTFIETEFADQGPGSRGLPPHFVD